MRQNKPWAGSTEAAEKSAETPKNVDICWGVKIPMRDGIQLNATIYKPKSGGPTPAIFTLTPYIADNYHGFGFYFAQHGYVFASIDCRGRGNSGGKFSPIIQEGPDGYDIVEWLANQEWCDGSVTMWGGSYAGFDQWMTLKEAPPHLKTIVPAASVYAGFDFPLYKNVLFSYAIQWLTFISGVTGNANLFGEDAFWIEKFRELYLSHRPFKELDQVAGNLTTDFQKWLQHPSLDAFWDQKALSPSDYDRIQIPILTITGFYDGDQPGALHYYREHMSSASPAREQHHLIIGPWDHAGTRTPNREFGGLKYGEASLLDLKKLHREWYDWTLKGGPKPEFLKQRVAYYLAGAEEWKYCDSLDTLANGTRQLYLNSSSGSANDAFHSGYLAETQPVQAQPDCYTYDPLDVRPAELEREEIKNYITDQRYALNLFGNGLVYHSAEFESAVEISGNLKLIVWIELDVPDTDFQALVYEILRDGSSILLTQDSLRARYRESLRQEKLVSPGEINCYEFDRFPFFSRRIGEGSRLRLVISSPNSIYNEKNYNSGGVVADESGKDARTAHVTLYHDLDHPSYLELPLVIPA